MHTQIDSKNLAQRYLPKQAGWDKILKIIQRKILEGTHFPATVKEIKAGYLNNPDFKDVYLYLAINKLSSHKAVIRRTETLAERYSLLFRLNTTPGKESAVLAIPESCIDRILTSYHSSIIEGHQGVIKMYVIINEKVFHTRSNILS